jgi:hypothetical protein
MSPVSDAQKTLKVETFQKLIDAILARKPVLRDIMVEFGDVSVLDYARRSLVNPVEQAFPERAPELLGVVHEEIGRLFGSDIATRAVQQMEKFYSVSTADHHGPMTHSFFLNPNLVCAAASAEDPECKKEFVITFPCANVSFNNSSFPRGILYHAMNTKTGGLDMGRLAFVPAKHRQAVLYGSPAYTRDDIKRVYADIDRQGTEFGLSRKLVNDLRGIVRDIYDQDYIYAQKDYSDQMSLTNYALWKRFFPADSGAPDLLHVPMENMAVNAFLKHHIDSDTTISKMVFNEEYAKILEELFNGVQGAFDTTTGSGTFMFWGLLPEKNYLVSLHRDGNFLVDVSGEFRVELTPAALRAALESKRIAPSMFFVFAVLAFYYGLRCVGGFSQVNYLVQMQEQWVKFLERIERSDEIPAVKKVQTRGFVGDLAIAYIKDAGGHDCLASGIDLMLYQTGETWKSLCHTIHKLSLSEAFYSLCADFYPVTYAATERDPELSAVNAADLLAHLQLDKHCEVCVKM